MNSFPPQIKFKYPWRKYQQRVLDALDAHMDDNHLHVIAPPGSGKTVLGLEAMLRIGHPTLIVAPTLAIRNQWIQRFCDLFLQQDLVPEWISKDIKSPNLITVVTYQGLHSACNDTKAIQLDFEDETDKKLKVKSNFLLLHEVVGKLKKAGIETFILDESHHLKKEWWQTLSRLKEALKPKIIGLTATPPYDVSPLEWHRYITLNCAVDIEISVPELMLEGDLCPHQDYIYFTTTTEEERRQILKRRGRVRQVYDELKDSVSLQQVIAHHPMIVDPLAQAYYIFENIDFYAACLIFLQANKVIISPEHWQLLGLIEEGKAIKVEPSKQPILQLPPLEEKWLEIILQYVLFKEKGYFDQYHKKVREDWLDKLKLVVI